jgi:hypothetical protein
MAGHLKTANTDNRYTKNGATTVRLLGLLLGLLLAPSGKLHAGSLDSTVIGMFPKDAGDIGYADLSAARELPWYPQFAAQVVPVSLFGFEQFLEAVQMRQASAINEVAWASVSVKPAPSDVPASSQAVSRDGEPVVIAIGDFDADTIKSYLESKNIPSLQVGNYVLYSAGTGAGSSNVFFTLLDSQTIAFGSLEPLKRTLRTRDGQEDSLLQNETMMTLIERANGNGVFWGVLNAEGAARAINRLVPQAANFPQSRGLIDKLKNVLITVKAQDDIEIDFQAASPSPADAVLLSQLLQAGVLMRRYQAKDGANPDLATVLDGLRLGANGNSLDISLALTNDQVISLIEHNTFSTKM